MKCDTCDKPGVQQRGIIFDGVTPQTRFAKWKPGEVYVACPECHRVRRKEESRKNDKLMADWFMEREAEFPEAAAYYRNGMQLT